MTLFLRTPHNDTIADIEIYEKSGERSPYVELHCSIDIGNYSRLLLGLPKDEVLAAIRDFDDLSELRGWMWESYFGGKDNTPDQMPGVLDAVRERLDGLSGKYRLSVVED